MLSFKICSSSMQLSLYIIDDGFLEFYSAFQFSYLIECLFSFSFQLFYLSFFFPHFLLGLFIHTLQFPYFFILILKGAIDSNLLFFRELCLGRQCSIQVLKFLFQMLSRRLIILQITAFTLQFLLSVLELFLDSNEFIGLHFM